jgi:hypothetical protein
LWGLSREDFGAEEDFHQYYSTDEGDCDTWKRADEEVLGELFAMELRESRERLCGNDQADGWQANVTRAL